MSFLSSPDFLCRIDTFEIFINKMIVHEGRLMYMSFIGRDSSVRNLVARIHQEGNLSLTSFKVIDAHDQDYLTPLDLSVIIDNPKHLNFTHQKFISQTFGNLTQGALVNERLETDQANQTAWHICSSNQPNRQEEIADIVRLISHIPVLSHWVPRLRQELRLSELIQELNLPKAGATGSFVLGDIQATKVTIPALLAEVVSELVQKNQLTLDAKPNVFPVLEI
jgi:hypothetical protein